MPVKVNITQKLSLFQDHWSPKIVGQINDHQVKLVKVMGEFVWHTHDNQDEMFYLIKGRLCIRFKDKDDVWLDPGEFIIIPKGIEHMPYAPTECEIMLIEPVGTLNTGDVESELTNEAEWI